MTFNPLWTWAAPAAACGIIGVWLLAPALPFLPLLLVGGLLGGVLAAVHHAEVIALKVGEPFGTLVLALSITTIEIALIVSMMLQGGKDVMALPRDTLFAAVMIILNGIVGLSLLMGGRKNKVQKFNLEGTTDALCTISLIVVVSMVLPNFTGGANGIYTPMQLGFVALLTLGVFIAFTRFQTVLHRDYFIMEGPGSNDSHEVPDLRTCLISLALLLASLCAVVVSAKSISPQLEALLDRSSAPPAMLGIIIAAIVLLPEFGASVRAARADRLQTSLNLALGSAIASIGLTVPVVAALALWMEWPLQWGLDGVSTILLTLTLFLVALSLRTGNTTRQPGALHLALFAVFLFFNLIP
ncbi:MAG: ionic transporter y4hA [Rhizobiales bacterium]|nr:ionic transporter y4hA [Hyphomicrobiales bacterium]